MTSPRPSTPPADGATFTAPASIAIAASASDSDGTIAKVDFYAGATLLGTDTSAPYQLTWSGVPAGAYPLTAVATDNDGDATTSSAVDVTVNSTGGLPSGWSNGDIGAVGAAGIELFLGPESGPEGCRAVPLAERVAALRAIV